MPQLPHVLKLRSEHFLLFLGEVKNEVYWFITQNWRNKSKIRHGSFVDQLPQFRLPFLFFGGVVHVVLNPGFGQPQKGPKMDPQYN